MRKARFPHRYSIGLDTYQQESTQYKIILDTLIAISNQYGYMLGMKLDLYLNLNKISIKKFADRLGVKSRVSIHRYINGTRVPSRRLIRKIAELTHGQVTEKDFAIKPLTPEKLFRENFKPTKADCIFSHRFLPFVGTSTLYWDHNDDTANQNQNYPLQHARRVLRDRLRLTECGHCRLDNRPAPVRTVIKEANRVLKMTGQPLIFYPGLNPIHDRAGPHMHLGL